MAIRKYRECQLFGEKEITILQRIRVGVRWLPSVEIVPISMQDD
jgi:hypothetical protein